MLTEFRKNSIVVHVQCRSYLEIMFREIKNITFQKLSLLSLEYLVFFLTITLIIPCITPS